MLSSSITRRKALQAVGVTIALGSAGCSSLNPFGCADHKAAVIRLKSVTENPSNPIHFADLPKNQQQFLREALNDGEYRECPYTAIENKEALNELAHTVAEHANSTENNRAYLEYQDDYYEFETMEIEDQVYA